MQKGTEANTHTDALASAVIRNGLELHGDNFDAERINRWYEEESSYGYVDLVRQTNSGRPWPVSVICQVFEAKAPSKTSLC